jgi:hypothetical protein
MAFAESGSDSCARAVRTLFLTRISLWPLITPYLEAKCNQENEGITKGRLAPHQLLVGLGITRSLNLDAGEGALDLGEVLRG